MPRTHRVRLVTWLQRLCADKTIRHLSTTSPWVLWPTSACLVAGLTLESRERRLEITYYRNKFKSKREKFQGDGQLRPPISSIK